MAEFDAVFQNIMVKLTESSGRASAPQNGRAFIEYADEPGDRFDYALKDEFDTSGVDQQYSAARESGKAWGEMGAMQVQHTIISMLRRDTQMRRRSRIRIAAHAQTRVDADASAGGPLSGGPVEYVKGLLEAAGGI